MTTVNYRTAQKCHTAVGKAVREGILVRKPCQVCGAGKGIHGHHDDYSKPLDVKWLCPTHHRARHKEIGQLIVADDQDDISFHMKIETELLSSLRKTATEQSRTVASLIRQAINYFLSQEWK